MTSYVSRYILSQPNLFTGNICPETLIMLAIAALLLYLSIGANGLKVPLITDNEFSISKESSTGFGVILIPKNENEAVNQSLQVLQQASATLQKHGTNIGILDCKISQSELCADHATEVLLFRNGKMVGDLQPDQITTQDEAEGNILHLLNHEILVPIESTDNWVSLRNKCAGKRNIVIAYVKVMGSEFHNLIVQSALKWKGKIEFAYGTDFELVNSLMPKSPKIGENGAVWISMCTVGLVQGECPLSQFVHPLKSELLADTFENMVFDHQLVKEIDGNDKASVMYNYVQKKLEDGSEIFLFVAGNGKMDRARLIANQICAKYFLSARCVLVNGDVQKSAAGNVVQKNRIHVTIIGHAESGKSEQFLLSETFEEVEEKYQLLTKNQREQEDNEPNEDDSKTGENEEENEEEPAGVETTQDDPVAFSVHTSRKILDLYLYDFKTLPRLTDVTYTEVINGTEFAVVLFTLEFNPKSLAALSIYSEIHEGYTKKQMKSPLYRVECFDWPDICKKEKLHTFPRMFFYRQNEERTAHEYKGVWSFNDMIQSIHYYSMPWPIMGLKDKLLETLPENTDMVIGIVDTKTGEEDFVKAARYYGKQAPFLMVKDEDAKIIAEADDIKSWNGKNFLIQNSVDHSKRPVPFNSFSDIQKFIELPADNQWNEITLSNFNKILDEDKPLVIQFINQTSSGVNKQNALSKTLKKMASNQEITSKAILSWMDLSAGSVGEYVWYVYSGAKSTQLPLVFLNKKENSVVIAKFEKVPTIDEVTLWINQCLNGQEATSFTLREHSWKPRHPGYDYLEMMKKEGTYPAAGQPAEEEMVKPVVKSARFGHQTQSAKAPQHTEL